MNSIQASQIMGGNGAKARKASDLYPTPPEVTVALMRFLKLPAGTDIWEPARGQGDMVRALADCGMAVYGTDIRDGIDFLTTRQPGNAPAADWIITNPPFSRGGRVYPPRGGDRQAVCDAAQGTVLARGEASTALPRDSAELRATADVAPGLPLQGTERQKGASPLMDVMWCVWLTPQMQGVQTVFKPLMRPEKVT